MRQENLKRLKNEAKILNSELENVEQTIEALNADSEREKDLKHLARLIYAGKVVEKAGLLYSLIPKLFVNFWLLTKLLCKNHLNKKKYIPLFEGIFSTRKNSPIKFN